MAKKRTKAINRRKNARQKVKEPVGHAKARVVNVEIDDPYYTASHYDSETNTRKIQASFNMNESPAALWKSKGTIDEAQLKAATRFRWLWESSGGSGASAMDYSAVKVDTSGVGDPISERQLQSVMELEECRVVLGTGFEIVQKTCGECHFLRQLYPRQYDQRKYAKLARDMLDVLACEWGFKTKSTRAA